MKIPQWFISGPYADWAKNFNIRKDQSALESDVLEYELIAMMYKMSVPPVVKVNIFDNVGLSRAESGQLKLAIRENVKWFLPYVELEFQTTKKINLPKLEVNEAKTELKGFSPKIGLNVVIVEDSELDDLRDNNVNGVMYHQFNTTLIEGSTLSEDDQKFRGVVNGFAETMKHELMHWFGKKVQPHGAYINDQTHYYDTNDALPNLTLANYLPKLAWALLHEEQFRIDNKI